MLDKTLGTNVPDFNDLVVGSGGNAGTVGVEANSVDLCLVVCVGMNRVLCVTPQSLTDLSSEPEQMRRVSGEN